MLEATVNFITISGAYGIFKLFSILKMTVRASGEIFNIY